MPTITLRRTPTERIDVLKNLILLHVRTNLGGVDQTILRTFAGGRISLPSLAGPRTRLAIKLPFSSK